MKAFEQRREIRVFGVRLESDRVALESFVVTLETRQLGGFGRG